jgi:hypothetical protein
MAFLEDCPVGQSQYLTQSRRQFLMSGFACIIPGAVKASKPEPAIKPVPQIPSNFFSNLDKPEFWLGDMVDFRWVDEDSGEPHSETGEVACAVQAGDIARRLAEENEIEQIKTRAITADVIDEISTCAYISQQQRKQEAEQILNPREHLERSLALTYDSDERSEPIAQKQLAEPEQNDRENGESERTKRIMQLKAQGWGKAKIILETWGVTKGGSPKYKVAESEYKRLSGEEI